MAYYKSMLNKAVIDLKILSSNVKSIKKRLNKNQKFCAVVKANAYGHGASEIANALYSECDYYAVALVEEGVKLRLSGIDKDILVLTPPTLGDIDLGVRYRLTFAVDSHEILNRIIYSSQVQHLKSKIHLKFNSGMNRFGVDDLNELDSLAKKVVNSKYLYLDGAFSHLHCPQNKKYANIACNKFLLANNLIKGYNSRAICHLEASGGFLSGIKTDMARLGILLYGYKPFESNYITVKPIMKVYAPVIKNRTLKKGDNCLYGEYQISQEQEISLVRFGYADGLFRRQVFGQVNNRCMDATAINIKNIKITKYGALIMDDANVLAREYNTIPYEILSKITMRAQKIYLR